MSVVVIITISITIPSITITNILCRRVCPQAVCRFRCFVFGFFLFRLPIV